ncbi:hypothetical protein [Tahibacter amnicola]|uniref:Delta-60 repeat protein n=1 Tax=Tahibacter amnicola TaxID=2976241 RepID=A0ABY6BAW2_9GAMM|nr:hypothetical protein [Tahibacter amnicola]UXI66290.1 hypothetical protein N4264_16205 [Tahibacter amnicola]
MHRRLVALALLPLSGLALADGGLDPNFGIQGRFAISDGNFYVPGGLVVQPDGRPVIWASVGVGDDCRGIGGRRLTANGTAVDPTFGNGGTAQACFKPLLPPTATSALTYNITAVNVPGGIVAVGYGGGSGNAYHLQLAKFTTNGMLDPGFGTGGLVCRNCNPASSVTEYAAEAVYHAAADAIVMAGHSYSSVSGPKSARMWVYSANGTPITQFLDGGLGDASLSAVAIQPDGKILAAGYAVNPTSGNEDCVVERFILQGNLMALDTTFNGTGRLLIPYDTGGTNMDRCESLLVGQDGLIFAGGWAEISGYFHTYATLSRITPSGVLDTQFSGDGKHTTYFETSAKINVITDMAFHDDGKILLAGYGGAPDNSGRGDEFGVMRISPAGAFDATFTATTPGSGFATVMVGFEPVTGSGSFDRLRSMALQAGNIVLYGTGAVDMPAVARLIGDKLFKNGFQ